MLNETEDKIPVEARNFQAPDASNPEVKPWRPGAIRSREELAAIFAGQEKWVLERTLEALEGMLSIPNSKDNSMTDEARQEGMLKVELIKTELAKRKEK